MTHLLCGDNLCLLIGRQGQVVGDMPWNLVSITNMLVDTNCFYRGGGLPHPLYLYNTNGQTTTDGTTRTPNLKPEIVEEIANRIGLTFEYEKSDSEGAFAPIDLLDYIYGVLHTPAYRERYREFLKVDFPHIPYPTDAAEFHRIATIGAELRKVHLMEAQLPTLTEYPIAGTNTVENIKATEPNEESKIDVYINDTQYFSGVPQTAWNHYIGGYQPAQKWLKDRKGKTLTFDDLMHYQRIIAALVRTSELMTKLHI